MSDDAYQLKFELDLPEDESGVSALNAEEVHAREEAARRLFESGENWAKDGAGNKIEPFNFDVYERLRAIRIPFRAAVLVMWLATPAKYRSPKTKKELADMLGLNSPRQFSVWMAKNPVLQNFVKEAWRSRSIERLSDSLEAMYTVAAENDYKGKGDRELHFKLAGILSDKIDLNLPNGQGLANLPFEEKLKLAGIDNPEEILALKARLRKEQEAEHVDGVERNPADDEQESTVDVEESNGSSDHIAA